MMSAEVQQFWDKIRRYQIGPADAALTFADRLARENGWSLDYTHRAILEYKRFMFLICVTNEPMSPSAAVDEVWHLHLLYTRDYWQQFCPQVLGREVHHSPTEGGAKEKQKHSDLYTDTLLQYQVWFGQDPPTDIWHHPNHSQKAPTLLMKQSTKPNWLKWKFLKN